MFDESYGSRTQFPLERRWFVKHFVDKTIIFFAG